ncbi:hypothetical protein FIBSPDRAFT_942727 [Athelia psychrophila]|uniref:Yeast cell wall synthesis Kre9/Knh1-like N-terminal domain-containing protein n=1 Tax=Athelia psychrophila TaxID=1759441 RepID=A0A166XBZ0_9AGAM|nr:hypothetical protein FIBSPDRAFT_942727 [Fibularhizoctonia sp. CBS 109695]
MRVSITNFCIGLFAMITMVSAVPVGKREVYVPPVLHPHNGIVWKIGSAYNVTWNTTNPPKQITNTIGAIYLRKGNLTLLDDPLASNFSILDGRAEIKVPSNISAGKDYRIVLFGDSGNWSEDFEIEESRH